MNKNKNTIIMVSLIATIIVFLENTLNIAEGMSIPNGYTLFILLRSLAVVGTAYVAYLAYTQNKKGWFWTIGITALWINASMAGGSISVIPMLLNITALVILITSIFGLNLDEAKKA